MKIIQENTLSNDTPKKKIGESISNFRTKIYGRMIVWPIAKHYSKKDDN